MRRGSGVCRAIPGWRNWTRLGTSFDVCRNVHRHAGLGLAIPRPGSGDAFREMAPAEGFFKPNERYICLLGSGVAACPALQLCTALVSGTPPETVGQLFPGYMFDLRLPSSLLRHSTAGANDGAPLIPFAFDEALQIRRCALFGRRERCRDFTQTLRHAGRIHRCNG